MDRLQAIMGISTVLNHDTQETFRCRLVIGRFPHFLVLRLPSNDRCWRIIHTLDDMPSLWGTVGEFIRPHGLAVCAKASTHLGVASHQHVIAVTEGQFPLAASLFYFPELQVTSEPSYEQTGLKMTPLPSSHVQNPTLPQEKVVRTEPCVASRDRKGQSFLQ